MFAHQYLIQEVLDELLLKRPRCKKAVQVRSEELGDEVAVSA